MKLTRLFNGIAALGMAAGIAGYLNTSEPPELEIARAPDVAVNLVDVKTAAIIANPASRTHLTFGKAAKPVPAQAEYCERLPYECVRTSDVVAMVALTDDLRERMSIINANANYVVTPVSDEAHYNKDDHWTFPHDLKADCDDYVKFKEDQLRKVGIPDAAMMEVAVRTSSGEGHVVLAVRTDKGDIVLDNLSHELKLPSETGHTFFKAYALGTNEWSKVSIAEDIKAGVAKSALSDFIENEHTLPKAKPPKRTRAASADVN